MKFKAIQRANLQDMEATEKKWYAKIVFNGETTVDDVVREIEKFSALSEPDIRGVIIALENVMQVELGKGNIVRFDMLGSLYPAISSSPSDTEEAVAASNIKSVGVNYRPGKRILQALEKAPKTKTK